MQPYFFDPRVSQQLAFHHGLCRAVLQRGIVSLRTSPIYSEGIPWVHLGAQKFQPLSGTSASLQGISLGVPSQFAGFPFFIHDERAAQPLPRISRTFPQGTRGLEVENLRGAANACGKGTLVNQIWKRKSTCFWNDDDVDDKDGDELNMNNYHGTGGLRWWCWC